MLHDLRPLVALALASTMIACGNNRENTLAVLPDTHQSEPLPATRTLQRESAISNYRNYLERSPDKAFANNALRRLADLELEAGESLVARDNANEVAAGKQTLQEAIKHYQTYLEKYPDNSDNDLVMYQLSKAYSMVGEQEHSLQIMDKMVATFPNANHLDEIQFRRGEILFSFSEYADAEQAYQYIVSQKPDSNLFEKARYKLGWSQFKQSRYTQCLDTFFGLLDSKHQTGVITNSDISTTISDAERNFAQDILRIVSITLSYNTDTSQLDSLFAFHPERSYRPLIYKSLGELYTSTERHLDAARVYIAFTRASANDPLAPEFHGLAIQAYRQGKFRDETLETMKTYVNLYGVKTGFYQTQTPERQQWLNSQLKTHLLELASYYHAAAKSGKSADKFLQAAYWYSLYVDSFPTDEKTPHINFLLADTLYDANDFSRAVVEYEKTAYGYGAHNEAADAGYAALLSHEKWLMQLEASTDPNRPEISAREKAARLNSAIRYCNTFPDHKFILPVSTRTAEELYAAGNYPLAIDLATRVTDNPNNQDTRLSLAAWTVRANASYELKDFTAAEYAYNEAIKLTPPKSKQHGELSEGLAASIYKQGEMERDNNNLELAAALFLRVGTAVPQSSIRATAEFDAATMYIKAGNWNKAVPVLENFRKTFPNHPDYARSISEKLAHSYAESGHYGKAGDEISLLILSEPDIEKRQQQTWLAADMYEKAGDRKKSTDMYIVYINNYPQPFERYIEAHFIVSEYFRNSRQYEQWGKWLSKTVEHERSGGEQRTERTHYIAASALIHITKPVIKQYESATLSMPIEKSLARKTALLEKALNAYKEIMSYQIAEFTTESTYRVGELYNQLAKSIMTSQRPGELSAEELEQYDILLEEQAFPFEEKAIEIHASNAARTRDGLYDQWVQKSLTLLASLQPARYQKPERTQTYALPDIQ